jgi:Archaeal ATPase.
MGIIKSDVRESYFSMFPSEEAMLTPFLSGFFVTWAKERKEYNTTLKVFFLSPEDHIKEAYGFENEILLIYAPYSTMEPRTLQAVEQIYSQSPVKGRVETLNYFLISDADNVKQWLDSYASSRQESRIIVSFTKTELEASKGDSWFIRNKLNERFFGRDLFNNRLPLVSDSYFFGRQQLLMEFLDAVRKRENRGIFGLRKTGKTSLLFKLKRMLEVENVATVVYLDCKLSHLRKARWFELLEEVAEEISNSLNIKKKFDFSEKKASKSFLALMSRAKEMERQICLVIDEVEYISFIAKLDIHWHDDFLDFWQTIWSCQSQNKNFSFIIAGVSPVVVEVDIVKGVQNPLFGIVPYQYLTGFSENEVRTMNKKLRQEDGTRF